MSAHDLALIGQLYLQRGRWGSRQLLTETWIRLSWTPCAVKPEYGYLWWIGRSGSFFASGYGGQSIGILPHLHTVVAVTTTPPKHGPGGIFRRFVAPAILE